MVPQFNFTYLTSLSILVFAVGGVEKISPYVNKVKDPSKGFPKGVIAVSYTHLLLHFVSLRKEVQRFSAL